MGAISDMIIVPRLHIGPVSFAMECTPWLLMDSRGHSATPDPRYHASSNELCHVTRKPADKTSYPKDGICEKEACFAAKDVTELTKVELYKSSYPKKRVLTLPYNGLWAVKRRFILHFPDRKHTRTYWKLVVVSMYPVVTQLIFSSCSNWLPIDAYVATTIVLSIVTRNMPAIMGNN